MSALRKLSATTSYGTKVQFQNNGKDAWVTIEVKNQATGQPEEKSVRLGKLVSPGVKITIRNGQPRTSPKDVSQVENSKVQPTWMARAFIRDGILVVE